MAQIDEMAAIYFGAHQITVFGNGRIDVDGDARSMGDFRSLDVFIDDDEAIDLKVTR